MMCLIWVDFIGTEAELEELDKVYRTCAGRVGVEYLGRFSSLGQKWNWTYFLRTPSMAKIEEFIALRFGMYKRDYSKFTHSAVEFFEGPY